MAQASCRGTCGCGVYVVDEIIGSRISSIMMENADFGVIYDPWAFGMGRKVTNHAAFDCAIHRRGGHSCRGGLTKSRDNRRIFGVSTPEFRHGSMGEPSNEEATDGAITHVVKSGNLGPDAPVGRASEGEAPHPPGYLWELLPGL